MLNSGKVTPSKMLQERPDIGRYRGVYVSMDELVALQAADLSLDLRGRRKALTAVAGQHRSSFRGRGIDFDEVRIYQPGDDVRNIDWRVTARTGRVHTKLFREERERPVYLVVDQRESMFFGTQKAFKSVVAARIAALLAWASRDHGDRIGGFLFNDRDVQELRPKEGKKGIQTFFRLLINHAPPRFSRDLRVVHRQLVGEGRAQWLGEPPHAVEPPPLADELTRTVARIRSLFGL